jgi:prefoldin alpha subunit
VSEESQREAQEKAVLYQVIQAQLEELVKQATALDTKMLEFEIAKNALEDMGKTEPGSGILVPLGAGCYAHGTLEKKDRFMAEIGAGLVKEKTLPEAIALVEEKKKEIGKLQDRVTGEAERLRASMDKIGLELNEMVKRDQETAAKEGAKDSRSSGITVE